MIASAQSDPNCFDPIALEAAKASAVFAIVADAETLEAAAEDGMVAFLSQASTKEVINAIMKVRFSSLLDLLRLPFPSYSTSHHLQVSSSELHRVLKDRVAPLFDPSKHFIAVATSSAKLEPLRDGFKKEHGIELSALEDLDLDAFLAGK